MIYEYRCDKCNHVSDYIRRVDQRNDMAMCKSCGSTQTHRMISRPNFDTLRMGIDAVGNPTAGDKWERLHREGAKVKPDPDDILGRPPNLSHV